jgi:hypothetical protein
VTNWLVVPDKLMERSGEAGLRVFVEKITIGKTGLGEKYKMQARHQTPNKSPFSCPRCGAADARQPLFG